MYLANPIGGSTLILMLLLLAPERTWRVIFSLHQSLGPTAIPLISLMMFCIVAAFVYQRLNDTRKKRIICQFILRNSGTAAAIGTLGTFIALASSSGSEGSNIQQLLSHALLSSVVGMSCRIIFQYRFGQEQEEIS